MSKYSTWNEFKAYVGTINRTNRYRIRISKHLTLREKEDLLAARNIVLMYRMKEEMGDKYTLKHQLHIAGLNKDYNIGETEVGKKKTAFKNRQEVCPAAQS